jgi:hypothetical protein
MLRTLDLRGGGALVISGATSHPTPASTFLLPAIVGGNAITGGASSVVRAVIGGAHHHRDRERDRGGRDKRFYPAHLLVVLVVAAGLTRDRSPSRVMK